MSYLLPHLTSGWAVDQAILSEETRLVCIRFGHDYDPVCMQMDEVLYSVAEKVKNWCVIYLIDTTEVPDFNTMYELYDPCTVMFFYRNKVCALCAWGGVWARGRGAAGARGLQGGPRTGTSPCQTRIPRARR